MEPTAEDLKGIIDRYNEVKVQMEGTGVAGVKLVCVSKFKPASCILELYKAGHRDFGENYVQELIGKASELPKDINWHFIGHLQSQKAKGLIRDVPNLAVMETVDTDKIASKLNSAVEQSERPPLDIFVQISTSDEGTKSGVEPAEAAALCEHIAKNCPFLRLKGLMTIGASGDYGCFDSLRECRNLVAAHLRIESESLDLSMGMSADFCEAIARGSTSVRVGSTIFGPRDYSKRNADAPVPSESGGETNKEATTPEEEATSTQK